VTWSRKKIQHVAAAMAGNGIRQVAHAALAELYAQTLHTRP
jgi:hypothetical protein